MNIFLLLGGNAGNTVDYLNRAIELLQRASVKIIAQSAYYSSEPWGFSADQFFINQVTQIETQLSPENLLQLCLQTETQLGRKRTQKSSNYISRVIDIDILFYNQLAMHTQTLILPHPRLHLRKFTLVPLSEIVPNFIHPVHQKTILTLLNECQDNSEVVVMEK